MSGVIVFPPKLGPAGDIGVLEPTAYVHYQQDFGTASPRVPFRGSDVNVERHPHRANSAREHTYWHMVTEGQPEETRTSPILERLERIPWVKTLLENARHQDVKFWCNARGSDRHFCLWHPKLNYLVIVKQTARVYLLKTTYCPEPRRILQLHSEYAAAKRSGQLG